MMPKIPALTPMPSVRTATAVSVKPGCLRRRRALYRRSCQMVVMPNIDVGRPEIFQCMQNFEGPLQKGSVHDRRAGALSRTLARGPLRCDGVGGRIVGLRFVERGQW